MEKQPMNHASIIKAWEQTHLPKRSRSRLSDYDILIHKKIEEGYTQQAVVDLLSALDCPTTHQNLSRYLKCNPKVSSDHSKKTVEHSATNATKVEKTKPTSGFSQMKEKMQGG
jgi:hypothetical protein